MHIGDVCWQCQHTELMAIEHSMQEASIVEDVRIVRVQSNGLVVVSQRSLVLIHATERESSIVERVAIGRIERDRLGKVLNR